MSNIMELLKRVALHLLGWDHPVEEHSRSFKIQGPAGLQLNLYPEAGKNGRLIAAPIWPQFDGVAITPFDTGQLPRTEKTIRASFSITKAPEVIAKDITRRVIEPYAKFFPGCLDQWERKKVEADYLLKHGQNIAEILGVDVKTCPGEVSMKIYSGCYGNISVLSGVTVKCNLNIRSLSINKAIEIAKILAS